MATAQEVIQGIIAIESDDSITQCQGEAIAAMFDGNFSLFVELDEGPGHYISSYYHGGDPKLYSYDMWHWKLRQARNNCEKFFEILRDPFLYRAPLVAVDEPEGVI